jgi:prophage regulatory protein
MPTERLLQQKDVTQVTSCSRTTIYRGVRAGTFPAPVRITERRVAWRETDVQAWIQSRGEVA